MTSRDGLSIDDPVNLSTMLTSVVLKVLSAKGEHLICLDVRKGAWDWASRNQYIFSLACMDLGKNKARHGSE